ncbi:MAG: membrane dipeptidase [Chloroflexi bacterium]|nr:membrane dipeptidase [Chloroflexota bacterium]
MLMIDAHLDLSWNALQWNRDLTQSAYIIRTQESATAGKGRALGTVALPELRQGRVAVCFATLLARATGVPIPHIDYATSAQAYGVAMGQLAYYRALEAQGLVRLIDTPATLDRHVAEWTAWDERAGIGATGSPPLGFVISMEGADPILTPAQLAEWHQAGLRVLGITHYGPGRYAGGTSTELGLTDIGCQLLEEMQRLGVILDLTHCSDQSFWQALQHYDGPVLASHNNCRALVPHQRQYSDEQIKAIIQRDGVIGAAMDAWMLQPGWVRGQSSNERVTLANVADHIDHVCQLAGNAHHAAIGSDLDGGFGREQSPHDLDTIADLQQLLVLLAQRGYRADDIAAIAHGNWLRLLRQAWA